MPYIHKLTFILASGRSRMDLYSYQSCVFSMKKPTLSSFPDPYNDLNEPMSRLVSWASTDDFRFIRSIRADSSTIKTTLAILFNRLCHELRNANITDYTKLDEFERALTGLRIVLGGTADGINVEKPRGNDRRRVKGTNNKA